MTFSVEGGGVWVFEEIDDESDDYLALRLAQNLKWVIREGARLRQEIELITDVEDEENYFINASVIAEAALTASLGLRAEARSSYNNQPGRGKEQHDVTLRYGISVNW
jgi:putative salt-induced outer membrane protein YdiY